MKLICADRLTQEERRELAAAARNAAQETGGAIESSYTVTEPGLVTS
jgi:hypothetical protein